MAESSQDDLVAQFCAVTGRQPADAIEYLRAHQFNLQSALTDFFTEGHPMDSSEDSDEEDRAGPAHAQPIPSVSSAFGGGRRLGDASDTQPTSAPGPSQPAASSSRKAPTQRKKFATIGDLSSGGHEGHGHADDDSDDDENKQDFFAGGEKSGLAVQNPDDLKKKILEKAKRAQRRPEEPKPRPSHFTGTARTLGGDDTPSQTIEPTQPPPGSQRPPRVDRILHFWSDGFSIDDGDLYRSDDPHNREILESIRRGRAPLSLMNVLPGQEVDVEIQQHSEAYVKPKKKYKPFEGQGNRLGSPTPGIDVSPSRHSTGPASQTPPSNEPPKVEVDESQPTLTLQIRLGDGSRLSSRFNASHTIGDVYSFVTASSPASASRSWVLMTTFPSKELTDKAAKLGDLSDFKRGGAVVQKWT